MTASNYHQLSLGLALERETGVKTGDKQLSDAFEILELHLRLQITNQRFSFLWAEL